MESEGKKLKFYHLGLILAVLVAKKSCAGCTNNDFFYFEIALRFL
jgi:hypothetical protein